MTGVNKRLATFRLLVLYVIKGWLDFVSFVCFTDNYNPLNIAFLSEFLFLSVIAFLYCAQSFAPPQQKKI